MKNQVQKFYSDEFGDLNIIMIDGAPYFPASDCAKILGYTNPRKAVIDHCPHLAKREVGVQTGLKADGSPAYQVVSANYIPEGDLYRLIVRSKLPAAVEFERWVFDTILPSIRKHGIFITRETLDEMLKSQEFTDDLLAELSEERSRNAALETEKSMLEAANTSLTPKAAYCDIVLKCGNAVQTSIIARDYGMTAIRFNQLLHELGIQFKIGNTWILYSKYASNGYTKSKTFYVKGRVAHIHTYWTQKGRNFLYSALKAEGILPFAEPPATV